VALAGVRILYNMHPGDKINFSPSPTKTTKFEVKISAKVQKQSRA